MNLVAKEYVAAQDPDNPGALVLSCFAGAARELDAALQVNPHDVDAMAEAMQQALVMPLAERRERYEAMIRVLRKNDITAWRESFVQSLAEAAGAAGKHDRAPRRRHRRDQRALRAVGRGRRAGAAARLCLRRLSRHGRGGRRPISPPSAPSRARPRSRWPRRWRATGSTLTNHPWSFSIEELQRRLGLTRLVVVNDFAANAMALPHLEPDGRQKIGGGSAAPRAPMAVLGPGSGLGVCGLVPGEHGPIAIAGEGGHATLAPADDRESEVLARMRRRFGHVSAERVLSGPGLVNLYQALAELDGAPAEPFSPAQIADREIGETHPLCRAAVDLFCAMLGTVAGDLALTLGARGGVFIAGGIVPRLGATFAQSRFRARFEDKGRFSAYLAAIPTYVVTYPIPAFLGLAALLDLHD